MVVGKKPTASKLFKGELKFRNRFGSKYPRLGSFELELKRFSFCDYEIKPTALHVSRPMRRRKKNGVLWWLP
jgi:hypothetical protein